MNRNRFFVLLTLIMPLLLQPLSAETSSSEPRQAGDVQLQNPITQEWVKQNLNPNHPRIILTQERLAKLKEAAERPGLVQTYLVWARANANRILAEKPVVHQMDGKRLLAVSREALNRIVCLSLVANLQPDPEALIRRLNEEILAVCAFKDWNPSHFLDTAEMALAVSIGLDWCHEMLPPATIAAGKQALVELALKPGLEATGPDSWFYKDNNWNQVCNGGLAAAAITVASEHPEIATKTLQRALVSIPLGLRAYRPEGLYPEGVSYWEYGTYYTAFTADILQSAFGTDFGVLEYPGLMESALAAVQLVGPSEINYNFFDCTTRMKPLRFFPLLGWFDAKLGTREFFNEQKLEQAVYLAIEDRKPSEWIELIPLVWLAGVPEAGPTPALPEIWMADGANPVVIFRGKPGSRGFYSGAKGGRADLPHGHMDAGSFIYEIDGIRWLIDPGNQSYKPLEDILGHGLWDYSQNSPKWSLLSKNNFGHSTLTVNGQRHQVDGDATMTKVADDTFEIDLSAVLGNEVARATRSFTRIGEHQVRILDSTVPNENTKRVVSAFMTSADVSIEPGAIVLKQGGHAVKIMVRGEPTPTINIVNLDPPPLDYDCKIPGLKRVEVEMTPPQAGDSASLEATFDIFPLDAP